ncbi:hypothetical protein PYW07_011702 [Mythimna separata]|uniref:Metaxin-2 n=1 Tax=Mythimna separata TaxID=271217 RepID=A0AAD8DKF6_MYTSE|nr:hypothetical protein PYW07_011702 [Mythimna separata]
MPEFHITDSIITQLNAQEPWPDNVKLFQPYEVEQILLPDNASCLAVQAFLKMCNLPFEVEMRWNAEFMSPSGRVPFIKCGAFVVSELESIVQFAANKSVSLCGRLSTEEKAEMRAYMSLITNVLVNAELYISWVDNETFNAVTKVRNSSVYPWPLGWLQTRAKRNAVIKRLKALHWYDKTLDQVLADVEQCCNSLSQRLGDKDYFFGNSPTPLDALVYGHMRAILMGGGMRAGAGALLKRITSSLLRHVLRCINLTKMLLTPQEEYLVTQAFQISRRRLSPERTLSERSTRIQRSRMSMRNPSKDNVVNNYNNRDIFGFKPFASKQIIIMTSKEGTITCQYPGQNENGDIIIDPEVYNSIFSIVEEILNKVFDLAIDEFAVKIDLDSEKNDPFEVISYPNDSKYVNVDAKVSEYLDTIEENDMTETSNSLELGDDVMIVHDDDTDNDLHELTDENVAGVREKSASQKTLVGECVSNVSLHRRSVIELNSKQIIITSDTCKLELETMNESAENNTDNLSFVVRPASPATTDCSIKTPQNEEISVEKLLRPTELDALVFGHVFTIITTRLPCRKLADVVRKHESLVALAKRVDEQYFKRP